MLSFGVCFILRMASSIVPSAENRLYMCSAQLAAPSDVAELPTVMVEVSCCMVPGISPRVVRVQLAPRDAPLSISAAMPLLASLFNNSALGS